MNNSISIIVTAYNAEQTINRCIDSLLRQLDVDNYQIIVLNDGSSDKTLEYLTSYKDNPKVRVIDKQNTGASDSRNVGLKLVNTEYVTFTDADDYVDNNYLSTMLDQYNKVSKCDLAICGYQKEDTNGKITMVGTGQKSILSREEALHDILISYGFEGYLVNKLFKTQIIRDNNLCFDKNISLSEDLLFCIQYLLRCRKVSLDPKPVYHYIRYEDSQLHKNQIGASFNMSATKILDTFDQIQRIIPDNYPKVQSAVKARKCWFAVALWRAIEAAPNRREISIEKVQELKVIAKKYRADFMKNDVLPSRDRVIYWINWFFPKGLAFVWNLAGLRDHS